MWFLLAAIPVLAGLAGVTPGGALTFDDALGLAARSPRVAGAERAVTTKRDFDERISRSPYNPLLTVQPGMRFYPSNAREPEAIVELVQPWNLSGLSGARQRTAHEETRALGAEARATALEQRLGAARAWLDLWAAQQVLERARGEADLAGQIELLVEKAAALQASTKADLADARAYRAEARLQVIAAEGEVFELGLVLARETATASRAPLVASGDLPAPALPPPSELNHYADLIVELPEVQALALRARAERARQIEERAARGFVAQIGVGMQRDSPGGLVVSAVARLQPPLFDHGERERGLIAALATRLEGEHLQARAAAVADLVTAFHEVEHTREILDALGEELVPASAEGAALRERIFQAGEATILEVLQARRLAMAAASRFLRARSLHAWARVKLWQLLASLPAAAGESDGEAP